MVDKRDVQRRMARLRSLLVHVQGEPRAAGYDPAGKLTDVAKDGKPVVRGIE